MIKLQYKIYPTFPLDSGDMPNAGTAAAIQFMLMLPKFERDYRAAVDRQAKSRRFGDPLLCIFRDHWKRDHG
jgi:hypothetical protein